MKDMRDLKATHFILQVVTLVKSFYFYVHMHLMALMHASGGTRTSEDPTLFVSGSHILIPGSPKIYFILLSFRQRQICRDNIARNYLVRATGYASLLHIF